MPSFSAVLFDLDGVIANTASFYKYAWQQFIQKSGLPFRLSDFEEEALFTKSLNQWCKTLELKYGIKIEKQKIIEETLSAEKKLMSEGLECDPTLIPFLSYCRSSGIKIAIGSSSEMRRILWVIKKMGIEEYFLNKGNNGQEIYNIISAGDIAHHKPDPEVWIRCAQMLKVPITDCLVIEDGLPGLTGAKTCGAKTVYYHGFCKPEKVCMEVAETSVRSFSELLS